MTSQRGRLILIPSPITDADLQGISAEVIQMLHSIDHFIVERARTSRRYISLTKPVKRIDDLSFIEMPEGVIPEEEIRLALQPLTEGKDIGVLSEAGLPAIADPGAKYVAIAQKMGFEVVPLAGPSSILMALMASGLEGQRFAFHGYLSAKKEELGKQLRDLEHRAGRDDATQIWIETPYRNGQILEAVANTINPKRMLCIAAGIGSEHSFIKTKSVADWKRHGWPEVHKIPAVFLLK